MPQIVDFEKKKKKTKNLDFIRIFFKEHQGHKSRNFCEYFSRDSPYFFELFSRHAQTIKLDFLKLFLRI